MNAHSLTLQDVARALGGKVVNDQVKAPGPNHSAKDDSMCIKLDHGAPDGFIVHSFAGDDPIACKDYIRSKLGLPQFESRRQAEASVERMTERAQSRARVVAEYVYQDEHGQPSRKVQRLDPKGAFPQYRWDGERWRAGVEGVPLYPYRLPEILKAVHNTIFICEGEKDVDRLASLGFVATTNPMGAPKWKAELNKWFVGKDCLILADNDKAGRDHARMVAENLFPVASSVRIVELPGLPEKGDVSDWLDIDPSRAASLVETALAYPIWTKAEEASTASQTEASPFIRADDLKAMEFPPISYVVKGYVVEGLTLLAGRPKIGKSWLVLDLAVAVSRGGFVLGDIHCSEGDVLYCALEDNPRRLQRRMEKLLQLQAWPKRLDFATAMPRLNEGGIAFLAEWIQQRERPRMIVIDTLAKVRTAKKPNEDIYAADYAAVTGLKELADQHGVAIVLVHHVRKMDADDPIDTVSGSTGLTGAVDSILVLNRTSQGTTLYGRGRDIEEIEKAAQFNRATCRWSIVGDAEEVQRSDERKVILATLADNPDAMSPSEIAAVSDMQTNNVKQLLFKMCKAGEVVKAGRGRYELPRGSGHKGDQSTTDNLDNRDNLGEAS